ncbi:MAG TPA: R3H domain-containing nucleic acid-binding protein [bacterium]|jgi:spoIIIJ-associated protein|nr:R3H domain-containing nucleic acid-binding protein [bacterium]
MDYIDKEALSVPEAVFAAARVLGIDEKDAQVQVLSAAGARRVKVRVGKPGVQMPPADAPQAGSAEARPERAERPERSEREERPERAPREERRDRPSGDSQAPMVQRQAPSIEQASRAQADLERLLTAMGTPAKVERKERAGNVVLNVVAPEHESLLIGRRGQTAEALQTLINEFMGRREGDPTLYLVVDVADYHGRAEERLIERAKELAGQVLRDGGQVSMGQLSSAERRVVHLTLKGMDGVESFSVGQGSTKKLVIQKLA